MKLFRVEQTLLKYQQAKQKRRSLNHIYYNKKKRSSKKNKVRRKKSCSIRSFLSLFLVLVEENLSDNYHRLFWWLLESKVSSDSLTFFVVSIPIIIV